jgi:hypothetical protein
MVVILHACGHQRRYILPGDRFVRDHHTHELSLSPCRGCAADWARLARAERLARPLQPVQPAA